MRVITLNANGLRSAARKGFFRWVARQRADVICIQELKAHAHQIAEPAFHLRGFQRFAAYAERPGYSGVAIYSRTAPLDVKYGFGNPEFDAEGRYVEARFADCAVVSVYFPSGSSSEARQEAKFRFLPSFEAHMRSKRESSVPYIFCGDVNIAHKPIDLKNWRSNRKNSGFLPEERAWMDNLLDNVGYVDAFRVVNQQPDEYTWWSNRGRSWEKNVGWRIDYELVTPDLLDRVERAAVYKRKRFSDHAPLIIDYDLASSQSAAAGARAGTPPPSDQGAT